MAETGKNKHDWGEELAEFLRLQPKVSAVKIDPETHKLQVATWGDVDLPNLQDKLRETITAIEEQHAKHLSEKALSGFTVRQKDGTTLVSRGDCVTA